MSSADDLQLEPNHDGQRLTFNEQMWALKADGWMPRDRWIYEEPLKNQLWAG